MACLMEVPQIGTKQHKRLISSHDTNDLPQKQRAHKSG